MFPTKTDYALAELRRRIICGDFAPGERLDLNDLTTVLGISRMPVREALSRLASQGLVEIHPQRWTSVTRLSRDDVIDAYEARLALETTLAGHGTKRLVPEVLDAMAQEIELQRTVADHGDLMAYLASDRRFHGLLYDQAGMPRTSGLVSDMRDVADRYVYLFLEDQSHRWESIAEHERIVQLGRDGDAEAMRTAVAEHVARGRDDLLVHLDRDAPTSAEPADTDAESTL